MAVARMRHMKKQFSKPGLQIRRTTRGNGGFLIVGPGRGIFSTSIFTHTRASAERIRDKVRRGEDITHADFVLDLDEE